MNENSPSQTIQCAGFWPRFVAFLIDCLIVAIVQSSIAPLVAFGFIQPWFWWANSFSNEPEALALWFVGTAALLLILIAGAYFVGFWVWRGQTPGKMAMGLRVARTDGSRVTAEQALLRYLGYIVSAAFGLVPFLWVAIDAHGRGIPDRFAGTLVVKLERQ